MKPGLKITGITLAIIIASLSSIFLLTRFAYNYKLAAMASELEQEILNKGLPRQTQVLKKYQGIEGPFSSNYCLMFAGVLFKTGLSHKEFIQNYPGLQLAWLKTETITVSGMADVIQTYPIHCQTCLPRGLRRMLQGLNNPGKENYAIIFQTENYYSDFDLRCF